MKKSFWIVQIIKLLLFLIIIAVLNKNRNYWQGWVFIGFTLLLVPPVLFLFKDKRDLAQERLSPGKGIKAWDKVFWVFFMILNIAVFIVSVIDAAWLKWSVEYPSYIYIISYIFLSIASALFLWAMHTNNWFSSVVRIQKDRKQKVVSTGPYAIVRHPGYLGGFFLYPALPLALGSLYGLIPAIMQLPLLIIRTYLEDNTLKKELKGYKEYTKETKYRLFPGLW